MVEVLNDRLMTTCQNPRMVVLCLLEAWALHVKGSPLTLTPGVSSPSLSHIPRQAPTGLLHRSANERSWHPLATVSPPGSPVPTLECHRSCTNTEDPDNTPAYRPQASCRLKIQSYTAPIHGQGRGNAYSLVSEAMACMM